ncbi:DNA helicase SRS2 Ecym_6343 [Eremothecium cymbalariae DBVPG|uniref:DNA 3'-5' helicase n=1 Tax=Eremothecium cymbalariae (strain CBS 270.75 / DBVPG 7215 / KCTC 17166 / NRRL Y-17582) TaxID=931890 RepID=G8JUD9_ERECY|nr:hypothetical protein Ecym_6343 [Eremothecium cymbalariae DBVPG\
MLLKPNIQWPLHCKHKAAFLNYQRVQKTPFARETTTNRVLLSNRVRDGASWLQLEDLPISYIMEFDLFNGLNPRQYEAVTFDPTKALQIVAGPGTGKTKVLTTRYVYLIAFKNINPLSIIMTTFTKKAADEIKARVEPILRKCGYDTNKLLIGTFHSICNNLLHQYGHLIDLPNHWRVFASSEVDPIVKKLVEECPDQIRDYALSYRANKVNLCLPNRKSEWALAEKQIIKNISRLKAEALSPEAYKNLDSHDEALYYFYNAYQVEMLRQGGLDYDDLLFYSYKLLSKNRCWNHIKHVMVDEFQDTNNIQLELMYLLSRGKHQSCEGVTAVGDPDQSIYAFRSALARNFDEMIQKCPIEYGQVVLEENYRSTQNILDTSEYVIKQQSDGRNQRLPLRAQFSYDIKPVYMKFPDGFLEGPTICKEILYLKAIPDLFSFNDIAILVRQRRQIKAIERALIDHRIPYKIIKSVSFWERRETKAMLDLLKVVCSDLDRYAIIRSLQYPSKGLGDVSIAKIEKLFDEELDKPAFVVLKELADGLKDHKFPAKGKVSIKNFVSLIETARKLCDENPKMSTRDELFEYLYDASGMKNEFLFEDDKADRKAKALEECEPNKYNKRHKNIELVKSHFLGFHPDEMDPKYRIEMNPDTNQPCIVNDAPVIKQDGEGLENLSKYFNSKLKPLTGKFDTSCGERVANNDAKQENENPRIDIYKFLRQFIEFINLYTTNEALDPSCLTEDQVAAKKQRDKNGILTVTTIHGSKGLEWPIVFVPGCVEGIIPCVYANSRDDDSEEENDVEDAKDTEDLQNSNDNSPKKGKQSKASESIDEERRMFFVALTRAKFLLYVSAIENNERVPIIPSQFLTPEVMRTLTGSQQLFDKVDYIDSLYEAMHKEPKRTPSFCLERLLEDYHNFVAANREFLIWKKEKILHVNTIDFGENIQTERFNMGITTASKQLKRSEKMLFGQDLNPCSRQSANYAPTISRKPSNTITRKQFAPPPTLSQRAPNTTGKTFAPKPNEHLKPPTENPKESVRRHKYVKIRSNTLEDVVIASECPQITGVKERVRSGMLSPSKSQHRIVAEEIRLEDLSDEDQCGEVNIKRDEVTAAELLHNPNDLEVDNRPILTNAKVLADASRIEISKKLNGGTKRNRNRKKIKKESENDNDILMRLKRARKATPTISDEVIVLD